MKKIIRFDKKDFLEIKEKIEPEMMKRNREGELKKKNLNNLEKKKVFDIEEELFITLFWVKNYLIDFLMEIFFERDSRTLKKIIKKTIFCLNLAYSNLIKWPKEEEFIKLKKYFKNYCGDSKEF